ncbi:MAG TPA: ATP-binding protein [Opitutaceae bacterium]|jgi:two-component system sensor histidine kinase KdpD|nr:ATP-binding protein [Opitutaceae bacterium]
MRGVFSTFATPRGALRDYAKVLTVIFLVTLCGWFTPTTMLSYNALGYIYLLSVIVLSMRLRRWAALFAAVLSALAWNFFFVPPRLSFSTLHFDEGLLLATYFVAASIGGQLASLRTEANRARLLAVSEQMHQTLLDSVSHELKTPIAVIRTAVEQLGTADAVRRDHLVHELRIATERLDILVGNLLNQSRLESGMLKPQLDWCDGRDLIASARRIVGSRLEDHPVRLEVPFDLPIFLADAVLMEQAIANLLLNAAVHTPPERQVMIGAGLSDDSRRILITVSDQGPGISGELKDRIFDKFSRGQASGKPGVGLGLSIVRGFMRAQGGDVSVESQVGGGARFTLFLPLTAHEGIPQG